MKREELNNLLQQVANEKLQELAACIEREAVVEQVGKPVSQTLLLPVRDPINGGRFFAGEVLVTSCIVKVNGVPGWAMVLDDESGRAFRVALLDAAYAAGVRRLEIEGLAQAGAQEERFRQQSLNRLVNGTRVSFDLL